jgi:hypothetical protein
MSFPLSPANNQVTLENGISYTYNASRGAWFRTPATALASLTSNTFTVLNSIIFSDGTSQTSAASPNDAYARTTANTATNNITIIQGVDSAQNTRMTIIEGVDAAQNTRLTNAEAVDATQNTNITIATNAATGAFAQANATAGGLTTANARITVAEGVDTTQNTNITAADTKAQAAFDKANTTITTSGGSITGSLNVSQNLTVSGNLSVLGTTTSINTQQYEVVDPLIKLGIGNYTTDQIDIGFAGHYNDGANAHTGLVRDFASKDYYLFQGYTPELTGNNNVDINHASFSTANLVASLKGNVIATTVTINGRNQASVDTTQNTNITTATVLAQAAFDAANTASGNQLYYLTRIYQGDGSTTTFTISSGHTANSIMVFNNGVCQFPVDDYTVSGTTLTYVLAPGTDETIQVREMTSIAPGTNSLMRRYTANGVQTTFTVTSGQTANSMFVYENGICQVPINDYTVSGTILTFVTAPIANVVVQIREMPI